VTAGVQGLLDEGHAAGVFPWARLTAWLDGRPALDIGAGGAPAGARFDLASLTKVVATTAVFMRLWADGAVAPEAPVARWLPDAPVARTGATLADLLCHRAGLPAFVPYFVEVLRGAPRLLEAGCPADVRRVAREALVRAALATEPAAPPGRRAVYSDVGFIVLGELLAAAGGAPLDALFATRVAAPLGLAVAFRRLSQPSAATGPAGAGPLVPTGARRPREPAPGQEGQWGPVPTAPSPAGEVDDDNAWAMDGVAGHAGLFGPASEVARFGQAVLDELHGAARLAPPASWERALRRDGETAGSTRAFGFDTRLPGDDPAGASAGRWIGDTGPGAAGHLGFTGTSLWIDRARRLTVALCTNRTALGRADGRIRAFRPRVHDAVVEALGLAGYSESGSPGRCSP
jgi:CubicO group peptidase (beta-lactamase class C family)